MFEPLRFWERYFSSGTPVAEAARSDGRDRRIDPRHDFVGHDVRLRLGRTEYLMRLRDISRSGVSGISDAPLRAGQLLQLEIGRHIWVAAEVRWISRAWAGLVFEEPLEPENVLQLRQHHEKAKQNAGGRRSAAARRRKG